MLGQPSPSIFRRIVGRAAVVTLALACGYSAWAAQSKDAPMTAVAAGRIQVKAVLRIDGGEPQTFTYTVAPGARLTMLQQSSHGREWTVDAVVNRGADAQKGMLMLAATIRRDGKVFGTPKIGMNSGVPGTIRIGEEGPPSAFEGIELVVTLTDGDADKMAATDIGTHAVSDLKPPAYPAEAVTRKLDGKVVLVLDLDAEGAVTGVNVERSEPAGVFDAAAVEAAWKWRFEPARERGKAVASKVRVPVTFEVAKSAGGNATPKA